MATYELRVTFDEAPDRGSPHGGLRHQKPRLIEAAGDVEAKEEAERFLIGTYGKKKREDMSAKLYCMREVPLE